MFYDKQSVAEYNIQKLQSLNKPIACINAIHNSLASTAKPDEAGGLYPVLYLASNAQVMLTANLWPQVGLCNGAAGYIEEILYSEGQQPPSLPICIPVCFDKYIGPPLFPDNPKCVPIPPIVFEWEYHATTLSRQQLSLQFCYANHSEVTRSDFTQSCHRHRELVVRKPQV